jgi:pSer/pThr/pTyr-binding forkhead associated (FHA) protein
MFTKLSFEDELPPQKTEDFIIEPDYELEEKTVLLTDSKPVGRLVYDGNSNEDDFIITKDVFTIGKSKNNDAVLKSRTVSGNHAKITKQGNDFFLTDSNSTNGSFLNSLPLVYKKPYRLKPMDVIRFASESYIFY